MRLTLLFAFLLSSPSFASDDLRSFTEKDMADLAGRIAKDLRRCKELKHGAQTTATFKNMTEEFIDADAFKNAILDQLPLGPGKAVELAIQLSSKVSQVGPRYSGTYELRVSLKQADEVLCRKSEKLVKQGEVAPKGR